MERKADVSLNTKLNTKYYIKVDRASPCGDHLPTHEGRIYWYSNDTLPSDSLRKAKLR